MPRIERFIGLVMAVASGMELHAGHWVLSAVMVGTAWFLVDVEAEA